MGVGVKMGMEGGYDNGKGRSSESGNGHRSENENGRGYY